MKDKKNVIHAKGGTRPSQNQKPNNSWSESSAGISNANMSRSTPAAEFDFKVNMNLLEEQARRHQLKRARLQKQILAIVREMKAEWKGGRLDNHADQLDEH